MIKFFNPLITKNDKLNLFKTVNRGWISSQGEIVKEFENKFASWHSMKFGIATSNCTTALHLSLLALNLKKNDEVICTALTFIAPANMIVHSGAKIVLVDVNKDTLTIDIESMNKKISSRTKVILIVHPFGNVVNMEEVMKIAKKNNIFVLEDNAESLGATFNNKLAGTFGDISCFSFFANKILTTGEGGMVLTNSEKIYKKIKLLRDHGMSEEKKYYHTALGFNYRMTSMQASLGISQLLRLKKIIKRKNQIKEQYIRNLNKFLNLDEVLIKKSFNSKCVNWFFTLKLKNSKYRNLFIKFLFLKKIECRPMIFPVSFAKHFKKIFKKQKFKNSKDISLRSVHLPTSLDLSINDINYICKIIKIWKANYPKSF